MKNLIAAKDVREKDYLRAKEHKMQRDREAEGDEFADKEKFVTGAYKRQQEELRQQEQVESKKEEAERKRRENFGQRTFLNNLLAQGERKHAENVTAASSGLTTKPATEEDTKKTEVEIAKELNAKGANIALTDDGEVADRRQLLSAGLNVIAKPKSTGNADVAKSKQRLNVSLSNRPGQGSRERQTRMMEAQLEQMLKRQADEQSEESRQKEHAAKSQKSSVDIGSARERYLQRKKAAAAAAGNTDPPV
jgi:hypothetical protein